MFFSLSQQKTSSSVRGVPIFQCPLIFLIHIITFALQTSRCSGKARNVCRDYEGARGTTALGRDKGGNSYSTVSFPKSTICQWCLTDCYRGIAGMRGLLLYLLNVKVEQAGLNITFLCSGWRYTWSSDSKPKGRGPNMSHQHLEGHNKLSFLHL